MTDRETEDAFDALFVGDDAPQTLSEALSRLPADVQTRIADDDALRQALAELVWMSNSLRASAPRPSVGFAERVSASAFDASIPGASPHGRWSTVGTVLAAALLLLVGVYVLRPQPQPLGGPDFAQKQPDPSPPETAPPTFALLDQVKNFVPTLTKEPVAFASLSGADVMSFAAKSDAKPLAKALKAPAQNLASLGKSIEKEVKPIGESVRDAFAFLGEFAVAEKRSL